MNRLNYRTMSFAQIHDDLLETANDLCFNAGEQQLELLLDDVGRIDENCDADPSERLVQIREELYEYDADLLQPRGQELMRFAVDEMLILAGKIGHNPDRLAASRACIKKNGGAYWLRTSRAGGLRAIIRLCQHLQRKNQSNGCQRTRLRIHR